MKPYPWHGHCRLFAFKHEGPATLEVPVQCFGNVLVLPQCEPSFRPP